MEQESWNFSTVILIWVLVLLQLSNLMLKLIYLVPPQSVEQSDAYDSSLDARVVRQRSECKRFHLNVDDAWLMDAL